MKKKKAVKPSTHESKPIQEWQCDFDIEPGGVRIFGPEMNRPVLISVQQLQIIMNHRKEILAFIKKGPPKRTPAQK